MTEGDIFKCVSRSIGYGNDYAWTFLPYRTHFRESFFSNASTVVLLDMHESIFDAGIGDIRDLITTTLEEQLFTMKYERPTNI